MADRVGHAGDTVMERGDPISPGRGEGSLLRSKDEWGSIIDILQSIENTTHTSKPVQSVLSPSSRLEPLTENIQSTGMVSAPDGKQGPGLQQLDHLVRMMEQMCHLQKQNSRLREQAEYLSAIKDLQELRNESLVQNCKCEAQRRSSDISRVADETFSEPESTVGDEMDPRRELSPAREKRTGRSIKRDSKTKSAKKRSRSLDPYRKDPSEPSEKDAERDRERERGRPGIFSKFEKMKEKLTTRRGSVKKHNPGKRMDDKQDEELRANVYRQDASPIEHFNLQMDGTETKSEDSGIFHVGLDEIVNLPRLPVEMLPKSQDEMSDNEDVFAAPQSTWPPANNFSMETRKGSDFSTGSSSEDYLELKPKRATPVLPLDEPVMLRSPEHRRRRADSEERTAKSSDEGEDSVCRNVRVRRSASLQDNASLNSDDEDFEQPSKPTWEVKEAPAILQSARKPLESSPSNDFDLSDASLDMQTGQDSASTSSLESKAAQKRKYFRKSQRVDEPISPTTDQRPKAVTCEMMSPKSSPPEKKRHKVGWEKVKHAVSRKHAGELSKTKGTVSMDEGLLRSSEEPSSPTDSSPPEDTYGARVKRSEVKRSDPKQREKERSPPPPQTSSSTEAQSPLAIYESLQANLSEDFAKKMEKWDRKKQRHGITGVSPLEKAKQSSVDSCSSEAGTLPTSDLEAELQRGLTEDFYKKLAEWDKLKHHQRGGSRPVLPSSPKAEPKQKQKVAKDGKKANKAGKNAGHSKEKERDKAKTKESVQQRSKSPDSFPPRKISPPSEAIYATENITVFAQQDGKLKLAGASKEFSKKYKEWEKKEKKKKNHPPLRAEDISSPVFDQAQALPGPFREGSGGGTPPTPSSPTTNGGSTDQELGDLYVVAHATPVIVEPDYDNGDDEGRLARAGEPVFRTRSAPPASVPGTAQRGGQQRPGSQRVPSVEEDIFPPQEACPSPPVPKERVNRLEQRNSFLAEQLKLEDVNLLAVQEEIVDMDEQLAAICGEKPEDRMERRVSTCSSIGESALEAELSDIKMQIAQLEETLKKRPRHKGHHGARGSAEVKGRAEAPDEAPYAGAMDAAGFTLHPIPTAEAQTGADEPSPSEPKAAAQESSDHSNLTMALEKSLHEREAIIRLLQNRVERQAQEINYLKSGSDAANQFRRAKSFTARDKKTFDPRSMKVVDILLEMPEVTKSKTQSDERSESSRSLKSDSLPSLEALHISAEDIRLDENLEESSAKIVEAEITPEAPPPESRKVPEQTAPDASKCEPSDDQLAVGKEPQEYPGLYGPIETIGKRRRTGSVEPPSRGPDNVPDEQESDISDSHAAVDALRAKKLEDGIHLPEPPAKDGSASPRSPRLSRSKEKDSEDKAPTSPSAAAKKVMPKFELVKLAEGLKSQAVELSPKTQRRREQESQENVKSDSGTSFGSPSEDRMSPREKWGTTESISPREDIKNTEKSSPRKSKESNEATSPSGGVERVKSSSPVERRAASKSSSPKSKQGTSESSSPKHRRESMERISPRPNKQGDKTKQAWDKDGKSKKEEWAEEKEHSSKKSSPNLEQTKVNFSERQPGRRSRTARTLSSENEPSLRSSQLERDLAPMGRERERRPSVENLRAAIERRQRSYSSDAVDSDAESQSNAKKALEMRLSGRSNSERRESTDSLGNNKHSPLEKKEPVLMRSSQKKDDKSVSSLRRKFVAQEMGSAPNVSDLTTLLTGRKGKERPREGCVRQMSQAFSAGDQGAGDIRSSKSSSVRSSPQSLSPASSNSSLSNIVASQIKRIQDKASSSPESPERRPSIQPRKDNLPSLYSIRGRLEHRQSLTNVADVRAKFDRKPESSTDSSPMTSRTSSPSEIRRHTRKDPSKPTLVPSVAAARIKYTVSVSNSEDNGPPKKSASLRQNGSTRNQRMKAVVESPQTEKSTKTDSSVSFTVNQSQKRRQNASHSAQSEENNNNSNNNNMNYTVRADIRRKGSSTNTTEASSKPNEKQGKNVKESGDQNLARKGSITRNEKRRGSLPRHTESSRDASRRGSITKGKESPKEATRKRSISKGKESPGCGSRRASLTKTHDSSNEDSKGKAVVKEAEPSKDASSLQVPGTLPDEDDRSRRRRKRRERNNPSPEPVRAHARIEVEVSEGKPDVKTASKPLAMSAGKQQTNTDSSHEGMGKAKQPDAPEVKQDGRVGDQPKNKPENRSSNQPKAKPDVKSGVKQELKPVVKTEVESEVKPDVPKGAKADVRQEVRPKVASDVKLEIKPDAKPGNKAEVKPVVKPEAKSTKPEVKAEVKPDRGQERRNRREERSRKQKERDEEAAKAKEEAAKLKAEAARVKLAKEMEAAKMKEEAVRSKGEKMAEDTKKAIRVERRESKRAERKESRKEKVAERGDLKKVTSGSELTQPEPDASMHSIPRRRHGKREEEKASSQAPQPSSQPPSKPGAGGDKAKKTEEEDPTMPDLLAQAQKKAPGEAEDAIVGRSARAILTNSALKGAEAAIGRPLPKTSPDEEEQKDDGSDERRSRKDATRRSRAINRGSRITRLDIFKRARSVDSSKASKDRSPDRLLGGGGASSRACSMDRSGKNRDKSPGGEETRKGGSWLSKRTGSISNFLRPSKV